MSAYKRKVQLLEEDLDRAEEQLTEVSKKAEKADAGLEEAQR